MALRWALCVRCLGKPRRGSVRAGALEVAQRTLCPRKGPQVSDSVCQCLPVGRVREAFGITRSLQGFRQPPDPNPSPFCPLSPPTQEMEELGGIFSHRRVTSPPPIQECLLVELLLNHSVDFGFPSPPHSFSILPTRLTEG